MTSTRTGVFDPAVQKAEEWMRDVMEGVGWEDPHRTYSLLKASLQALRDRLSVDSAVHLSAQLPLVIRGVFFDSWRPARTPRRERRLEDFLDHVQALYGQREPIPDPERAVRAVFRVLARHVTEGEIEKIEHCMPEELRTLWNGAPAGR